jgi:hypothetical protein
MPKRSSSSKRPLDTNQRAASVVAAATGERPRTSSRPKRKNPAAVALGRKGGLKGGKARAASLSPEERSEIARRAAAARWKDKPAE